MQMKVFAAAFVALSSVQAAAVSPRQAFTFNPGSIILPSFTFDPAALGVEQKARDAIEELRQNVAATTLLINQLNAEARGNVDKRIKDTKIFIDALNNNVNQIRAQFITPLINKATAKPTGGSGSGPGATPTAPGLPAVPTQTVNAAVADVGKAAEDLVAEVANLVQQARAQSALLKTQADALLASLVGAGVGVITGTTTSVKTAQDSTNEALKAAYVNIATFSSDFLSSVSTGLSTVQGTATATLDRLSKARANLNPFIAVGAQPDIVI